MELIWEILYLLSLAKIQKNRILFGKTKCFFIYYEFVMLKMFLVVVEVGYRSPL